MSGCSSVRVASPPRDNTSMKSLTLPGFNVHQDFDNVLMNGERDGQGNGTESEIYGRVQAGGITVGGIGRHQPSRPAARDAGVESGELDAAQAKRKVAGGVRGDAHEGFAGGVGSGEQSLAARARQH